MPDLLMSVEIPRGSLGVPKHQRDCVPTAKVFHYRVPSFQFPPPRSTTVHSTRKPIPSMNRYKCALKPAMNFRSRDVVSIDVKIGKYGEKR